MDVQILCISLTTKACTPCMQGVGASAQQRICHKWRRAARAEPGATDQAQSTQAEACSARRTRQPAHHNTSGGAQHAQSQEQLRMTLYALPVRTLFWCAAHDTRHCTYDFDDGVHKRLKGIVPKAAHLSLCRLFLRVALRLRILRTQGRPEGAEDAVDQGDCARGLFQNGRVEFLTGNDAKAGHAVFFGDAFRAGRFDTVLIAYWGWLFAKKLGCSACKLL
eukprot:767802-Pelagomonas_calceolata.AAC.2